MFLIFCSGKILHIDFGDCFEASMNREKFPEKVCSRIFFFSFIFWIIGIIDILLSLILHFPVQVPFRLTRMLVKAMEVSGIEGNFRSTCENVMQVLRTNKDSVMAMMEVLNLCFHSPLPIMHPAFKNAQ